MFWDIMGVERKYTQCVSVILISRTPALSVILCFMTFYVACYVNAGCAVLLVLVLVIDPSVLISSCCVCSVYFLGLVFSLWCLCVFCVVFFRTRRHYLIFHLGTEGSRGGDIIWVWSWWLFFHLSPCVRVLRHEPPSLPE